MEQKIAAALVAAQRAGRAVALDGQNKHQQYKYATAEAIIEEGRAALNSVGLAVMATAWSTAEQSGFPHVVVEYLVVHDSGESVACRCSTPIEVGKGRPPDKASLAALTGNLAYFLRALLLLPRDDNAAAIDQRDDRGYDPHAAADARAAAAAPTPATPAPAPSAAPPATPPPAAPVDVQEAEARTWEALMDEFDAEGRLDELERMPKKIQAYGFRKELYARLVAKYNPIVARLRKAAEASRRAA